MIPEPAPAQLRLSTWVDDDLGRECLAMSRACDALMESVQIPQHTAEAAWALHEMIGQYTNIGCHWGWPRWREVCAHAVLLVPRCADDGAVREWIGSLFLVWRSEQTASELIESCPVPPALESTSSGSSWAAQGLSLPEETQDGAPWEQHATDTCAGATLTVPELGDEERVPERESDSAQEQGVSEAESSPEPVDEEILAACAQVASFAAEPVALRPEQHVEQEGTPLVVFRAAGRLYALRARCVASVVRKARTTLPEEGEAACGGFDYEMRDSTVSRECTHAPPEVQIEDRFEIVLDASAEGTPLGAQACLGVHTARVVPVPEGMQTSGVAGVASIAGAGVALVYEVEDYVERVSH